MKLFNVRNKLIQINEGVELNNHMLFIKATIFIVHKIITTNVTLKAVFKRVKIG